MAVVKRAGARVATSAILSKAAVDAAWKRQPSCRYCASHHVFVIQATGLAFCELCSRPWEPYVEPPPKERVRQITDRERAEWPC